MTLPNAQEAKEKDSVFMEMIREFPTIHNRALNDFKDRIKKANSRKTIADFLDDIIDSVKRRYDSIKTDFSRYLRQRREKSSSSSDIAVIDPKYEHLYLLH